MGAGKRALECDEFRFVWIDFQPIAQEPVGDSEEAICALLSDQLVIGPGCHDSAVVDVSRERAEAPGFGNAEEWEDVQGRQDGGQRRSLGGAVIQDNFRKRFAVE